MMRTVLLLSCFALPVAAQTTSKAELAYRDAWWAETGKNDLEAALRGYLAAATADGPRLIHGKALFAAACVQQRLGKTDSAIQSFRQLLADHADDASLTERAHAHLRELTAIDLRDGYDEWYEKRLFSEAVQLQILENVEQLASLAVSVYPPNDGREVARRDQRDALTRAILAFGAGAVPALHKASLSPNRDLARICTGMLLRMGELPPPAALARDAFWADDPAVWQMFLRMPPGQKQALLRDLPAEFDGASLLRAALVGHAELVASLRACEEARMLSESSEFVTAIAEALLRTGSKARRAVLDLMVDEACLHEVRRAIEQVFLNGEHGAPLTSADWLAIGEQPLEFGLRDVAIAGCTRALRAEDGDQLDRAIARIADSVLPAEMISSTCYEFANGLEQNPYRDLLPWTAARLRAVLMLPVAGESLVVGMIRPCRARERTRRMLADALFGDPAPLRRVFDDEHEASLSTLFSIEDGDERQDYLDGTRWCRALAASLAQHWGDLDAEGRLAALSITVEVLEGSPGDRSSMRQQLGSLLEDADDEVRQALVKARNELDGE